MKFLFLTSGAHVPSTRFRMLPLATRLREQGHTCHVSHSFPEKYDHFPKIGFRPSQWLKRLLRRRDVLRARWGGYDAVILERELFDNASYDVEAALRRVARTLVLDIDDGVFLKFPEKFRQLLDMADLVVAGNRLLAEWASAVNRNVVIIPTCIDTSDYQPRPVTPPSDSARATGGRPVIGWMGTSGNIAYLREIAGPLRSLAARHDFEFQVIAGDRGVLDELPLEGVNVRFRPWKPESESTDILEFDIGVMPLSDDPWSRYKCGLKLLQYMAIGIPGVASPVGVNADIISQGIDGFLASTASEWETALAELLASPQRRQQMGTAARQTVLGRYSLEVNLPRWLEAVGQTVRRACDA